MPQTSARPFSGTYRAQPAPSTVAFAIRHSDTFWFRGWLSDVTATLRADGGKLELEGVARVDSISIVEPEALRAHLLAGDFFDAERHPELRFRSTELRLGDDGSAQLEGELTLRGVTRPVLATGAYSPPLAVTFGEVAGLQLHTSFDRREFGFDWQAELPGGGLAIGWEVEVDIDLMLMADPE